MCVMHFYKKSFNYYRSLKKMYKLAFASKTKQCKMGMVINALTLAVNAQTIAMHIWYV